MIQFNWLILYYIAPSGRQKQNKAKAEHAQDLFKVNYCLFCLSLFDNWQEFLYRITKYANFIPLKTWQYEESQHLVDRYCCFHPHSEGCGCNDYNDL
jgi:hypothetical protein